jgi:hypothetical protein
MWLELAGMWGRSFGGIWVIVALPACVMGGECSGVKIQMLRKVAIDLGVVPGQPFGGGRWRPSRERAHIPGLCG